MNEEGASFSSRALVVSDREFGAERIVIDGMRFANCTFTGTVFAYFGGPPPVLHNCRMKDVGFDLGGPAKNTAQFLKSLIEHKVIPGL